jgi:Amt family ammonium transporter
MIAIDSGDTAFMLLCAALVLFMTPGLALFYGGLVRSKNVVNTMMMSFIAMAVVAVQWVLFGYSVAFGPGRGLLGAIIGSPEWIGLEGVGGWLREMGALDFAGGTVVHISAGVAALVATLMLGPRTGFPERITPPHNVSLTLLG